MDDFDASTFPMTGNITETTSEQCFNITIINDNRREDTEIFTVQFEVTDSRGNFLLDPNNTTVSIIDDDGGCTTLILYNLYEGYVFVLQF